MPGYPTTKLRPARPAATLVERPRLEAALERARRQLRATLLVAPAGYGKTTALCAWLLRSRSEAAWFTLDPGDDLGSEPAALVARWLTAALEAAGAWGPDQPDAGAEVRDPSEVAAALEANGWHGVIVFDDAHHLGPPAAAALAAWIERAPEGVHTVVSARHAPALPIARWLARGEAEVLGADALRLRPEEGRTLLAQLLPELSSAHADALVARVEGWPAGVLLAARSLRGKADPGDVIERFTGTDRYVLAFLTEEVLLRLPDDLHQAAVLLAGEPRLCAGLVDAVTMSSGGAALLARLEQHEAFLERLDVVDEDGPWFRFPDFFRDLLAHRLALAHPDLPAELAGRAAGWWETRAARTAAGHARAMAPGGSVEEALGSLPEPLTERERQVLAMLVVGATTKAVARELGLSPNTVKTHTRRLFEKLGVRSRTQAAAVARERGLV
jgi:LuxR family transcriptional regulator, maltose regulon positive regulatory protein